jgi:arylsulfatase A-like enzyme
MQLRIKAVAVLSVVVLAVMGLAFAPVQRTAVAAESHRPNVLFIMMDDMRKDDLRWMPAVRSRIFAQGQTYRNHYAPTSLCCPNRWTALKGQYPRNHGVMANTEPYGGFEGSQNNDGSTLSTWLAGSYYTGYVGKYLNGYEREIYVPPGWSDWQGSSCTYHFTQPCTNDNGIIVDDGAAYNEKVHTTRSIEFIRSTNDGLFPYFLHTAYVTPHHGPPHNDGDEQVATPWVPPAYRGTYDGPRHVATPSFNERDTSDKQGPVAKLPPLSASDLHELAIQTRQRREALMATDAQIARLLNAVDATGEATYVIFTSDNGNMLGDHRYPMGKTKPYEAASNIPLGIRGPGITPGSVYRGVTGTQDIAPSILNIAQVPAPYELDGRNIIPPRDVLANRGILLMSREGPIDPEDGGAVIQAAEEPGWTYRGLVTQRWKLIRWPNQDGWELFDLTNDPDELVNLVNNPEYDAVEEQMKAHLDRLWNCSGRSCDL